MLQRQKVFYLIKILFGWCFLSLIFYTPINAFYEEFNSGYSDISYWELFPNAGSILFSNEKIILSTPNNSFNSFPYIKNVKNIFPSNGEFSLDISFKYLAAGKYGDGVVISKSAPINGMSVDVEDVLFKIWQDSPIKLRVVSHICSDTQPNCNKLQPNLFFHTQEVDLNDHTVKITYSNDGVYRVFVDNFDDPIFTSTPHQDRPSKILLGNSVNTGIYSDYWSPFEVIGGKKELEEKAVSGWEKFQGHSPHKPFLDEIKVKCSKCGRPISRIEPVGNPWLDAGIVPFSTMKYTEDKKYFDDWFPADFITESFPGQFKNWFYSMIAMSTVLENKQSFNNVLGHASMLDSTGKTFHKSAGNSIEFVNGADRFSADVIRWYCASQNPARDICFGEKQANQTKRQFHMFLWNSYRFFVNYASLEKWQPKDIKKLKLTLLDNWILSRLDETISTVTKNLDKFNSHIGAQAIEELVNDLSGWYIRRSRNRVGAGVTDESDKDACYQTLFTVLEVLSRMLMPYIPFLADTIYTNLTGEESVNLADWPSPASTKINTKLLTQMKLIRKICELGHAQRKEKELAVKQPLASITVSTNDFQDIPDSKPLLQLIKEELNVKKVIFQKSKTLLSIELDTKLTPDLILQRQAREVIRSIQQARKTAGCTLDQHVNITLPDWPKKYEELIKQKTLVDKITKGETVSIIK